MKTRLSFLLTFALALLFFATPSSVHAHKLNTSYTNLIAEDDALKVRVRLDDFDLLKIGVDQDGDSLLFYEEMEAGLDDVFAFVEKQMRLRANGEPLTLVRDRGDVTPDNKGNMFANVYFSAELEEPVNGAGGLGRLARALWGRAQKFGQNHVAWAAARPSRVFRRNRRSRPLLERSRCGTIYTSSRCLGWSTFFSAMTTSCFCWR